MIITKEWLNEYIDIEQVTTEALVKTLNKIGLEVASLKEYRVPKGVVVGKVLEYKKHPNADKLNIVTVDIGSESLQIVCGAKNIAGEQLVAVAKIGSILHNSIEIKKTNLRGVESHGMICSASEIGLIDICDGILELDESIGRLNVGDELSKNRYLNDDIIELELTPNRGDCLSIYGVARDLSAALDIEFIKKDIVYREDRRAIGRVVELDNYSNIHSQLKYMFFEINKIEKEILISLRLSMCGFKLDNALQDYINYAIQESGVLLRAYDFYTLYSDENGKAIIELKKDECGVDSIYNNHYKLSQVGIRQDEAFAYSNQCDKVLIEASYIEPEKLNLDRYNNSLNTDELYYRSSRGSEPDLELGLRVLGEHLDSNVSIYSGYEGTIDTTEKKMIQLNESFIENFIGNKIDDTTIIHILQNLGFETQFKGEFYIVKAPLHRSDITHAQDIVEELVRMYGIDNIVSKPLEFTQKRSINSVYQKIKKRRFYRNRAVGAGFYESIHYFFENSSELKKYGFATINESMDLKNPISSELNSFRTTLLLHLLRSASKNSRNGIKNIRMFELGKVVDENLKESEKFSFIMTGSFEDLAIHLSKIVGPFSLKKEETKNRLFNPYEYAKVILNGRDIGIVGRVHIEVEENFDLSKSYLCELDFEALKDDTVEVVPYSKYQSSTRDLSVVIAKNIDFTQIENIVSKNKIEFLKSLYPIDLFESEELKGKKSLTIRFIFQKSDANLELGEISQAMDTIQDSLKNSLGAELR
jgi:phenylalanyl-tRNA synthetase beta chain